MYEALEKSSATNRASKKVTLARAVGQRDCCLSRGCHESMQSSHVFSTSVAKSKRRDLFGAFRHARRLLHYRMNVLWEDRPCPFMS